MLVTLLMGYFSFMPDRAIKSGILVAGLFLSIVFNGLTSIWVLGRMAINKDHFSLFQPAWLFILNFLCFIFQLYMLLK
jgi:hypothetical protein